MGFAVVALVWPHHQHMIIIHVALEQGMSMPYEVILPNWTLYSKARCLEKNARITYVVMRLDCVLKKRTPFLESMVNTTGRAFVVTQRKRNSLLALM